MVVSIELMAIFEFVFSLSSYVLVNAQFAAIVSDKIWEHLSLHPFSPSFSFSRVSSASNDVMELFLGALYLLQSQIRLVL